MTFPLPTPAGNAPDPIQRANWLGRYLGVERKFDDKLKAVLTDALSGIGDAFEDLGDNFSSKVRRQQLAASAKSVRGIIHGIFGDTGNLIREHRSDAAVAAVDAQLYDERGILARLFPSPVHRQQYADSLRQSASRNVESVITRVLETERPLSARVYKSEALANHQVSIAINRALARGDSAKNLAKSVESLIDPGVPGGISYAASRLGRTEINNAFHAQSIHGAQETPWTQDMEWHLSKVHEKDPGDECEIYALQRFFMVEHVPEKPHPNCRCYVTPKPPDYDTFQHGLLSGHYDDYLDEVLGVKTAQEIAGDVPPRVQAAYEKARAEGKSSFYPDSSWSPAEKKAAQKLNNKMAMEAEAAPPPDVDVIIDDTIPKSIAEAENSKQVQNWLESEYSGLEVSGFDREDVDVRAAKEIGQTFAERQAKHPRTNIRALRIVDDLPENVPAETRFNHDGQQQSDIVYNRSFVTNYNDALSAARESQRTNWHGKRNAESPFVGTTIHEWGHVLSYSGGTDLERGLGPLTADREWARTGKDVPAPKVGMGMFEYYLERVRGFDLQFDTIPDDAESAYRSWVLGGLPSGYSYKAKYGTSAAQARKKNLAINAPEAVAEGYAETVNNPNASDVSIGIYNRLIGDIKNNDRLKVKVKRRGRN